MKVIFTGGIALCALALYAAEPQQKQNTTETVIAAPAAVQVQDSPLVRAAKATGRLQKKATNVITNDTLLKTGGHFTTMKSQNPLPPLPEAPPAVAPPRMSAAIPTTDRTANRGDGPGQVSVWSADCVMELASSSAQRRPASRAGSAARPAG